MPTIPADTDILSALPFARCPSGNPIPDNERARAIYLRIDAEAARIGAIYAKRYPIIDELRNRPGTPDMVARCRDLADAIERDPRLAALPDLYGWAKSGRSGGVCPTWLNWYARLLDAHLAARAVLQAAE